MSEMNALRTNLLSLAVLALSSYGYADTSTWSYLFNTTVANGGNGFYALSTSESNPDTVFTSIGSIVWSVYSEGTKKYAVTVNNGQCIGTGANQASAHTSLYTYEIPGNITAVRVEAKRNTKSDGADLKVSVNKNAYLCNDVESAAIGTEFASFEFKPSTQAEYGKLDIELFQTQANKNILYIRSIEVDYESNGELVTAPVISLKSGDDKEPQVIVLNTPDYTDGTYTIYYTLNGGSPIDPTCRGRMTYSQPVPFLQSAEVRAVTEKEGIFSLVSSATFKVLQDPDISFSDDTVYIEAPDDGISPLLNNPHNVSPISYKCSDETVCYVNAKSGYLSTIQPGECIVSAIFAGNDEFKADTAQFVLIVTQKKPLNRPVVTPLGGTFTEPVEVTISVEDDRAYTIWYSTTAADSAALTDDPEIIPAKNGTITISESCHLLVLAAGYSVFSPLVEADFVINQKPEAMFCADEANQVYYEQGFDSMEEVNGWKLKSSSDTTFTLSPNPFLSPYTSFSTIDPSNKYSLSIDYSQTEKQNEMFVSPIMTIEPNSTLEFYSFFSGVWLFDANWTVSIYDVEKDDLQIAVSGFQWAQNNGFTGPAWIRFNSELSKYSGRQVSIVFTYKGTYGEAVSFDGLKLLKQDMSENAKICITEGDTIHYHDLSVGATHRKWEFPGGKVIVDDSINPVVVYEKVGIYDTKLTVSNDIEETSTLVRNGYVEVKPEMPKAIAELPTEGYLSPYTGVFIPLNVPVTFHDRSTGNPTEREWHFYGTDVETSTDANPVVTYIKPGTYGLELEVANEVGRDQDIIRYAIQAGGAQYIWNISMEERQHLYPISLSFYGYYAGSNWLMMDEFAEKFKAPLAEATIDSVDVFFESTETITPEQLITVYIREDSCGMPGKAIAQGSVKAGDLKWDAKDVVATTFHLNQTAKVSNDFFVSIGGFPNNYSEETNETDNIAILCARREINDLNTVYHLMDTTSTYTPSGIYAWYENNTSPLSMAICPILDYGITTAIETIHSKSSERSGKFLNEDKLYIKKREQTYDLQGRRIK